MTIATSSSTTTVLGDGSNTSFAFSFVADSADFIGVIFTDTDNTQTTLDPTSYTLVINPASVGQIWGIGGTVTYPLSGSPIALGTSLTISRVLPYTQVISISNQGDFAPQVIEEMGDTLEMQIQQVAARTTQFRGTWITNEDYTIGDIVQDGANGADTLNYYICTIANTSGVWATDLSAGDWAISVLAVVPTNNLPITLNGNVTGTGTTVIITQIASHVVTVSNIASIAAGTYFSNPTAATANPAASRLPPLSCFQLQKSGTTTVSIMPFNGNQITFPNGFIHILGSSGLASGSIVGGCNFNGVASSTLSASTAYYVYDWYNSGTPAIDFSTTGHTKDSTTGIEIKSGDSTRVLAGLIYPTAGPVVTDSGSNRLIASWVNRQNKNFANVFSTDRTTTATAYSEINNEIRCQFLTWGDGVQAAYSGSIQQSQSAQTVYSGIAVDGIVTTFAGPIGFHCASNAVNYAVGITGTSTPAEGFHFLTVVGAVSANTGTWTRSVNGAVSSGLNGAVLI